MGRDPAGAVAVVGSLAMDFTAFAGRFPRVGETLVGDAFTMVPGGKGGNQAIAAARQGARTSMIGCVGRDLLGDQVLDTLRADQVDTGHILRSEQTQTGVAHIVVDGAGDNAIIAVPLANTELTPAHIDACADVIAAADVLLVQLEIPIESVAHALRIATSAGTMTILNPAPARQLSDELLLDVDVVMPNETEAEILTSTSVREVADAEEAALALARRGIGEVVITLGDRGAIYHVGGRSELVRPYDVDAVDATAAGDAFCGAFAAGIARGDTRRAALEYAAAAGALAVTVEGASSSLPTLEDVERLHRSRS